MGELRKDYFRDRYVIINPERARRPDDFKHAVDAAPVKLTPFTPGNEHELPTILAEEPQGPQWRFRAVPNKFAIVRAEGDANLRTANELFTWASNYGKHEILIDGQEDHVPYASLGPAGIAQSIAFALQRVKAMQNDPAIKHIALFKNEGREAGASIDHPHSQIIGTAIVPPAVTTSSVLFQTLRTQWGFSPLYKVLDKERGGERIIAETQHFVALCPYASRFPMEVLIIPLRDAPSYTTITDAERLDLGALLHKVLARLATIGSPYNIEWMHASDASFHWHITITPRLAIWAGYELETNIIVNPIPPEHAAAFYRGT